MWNSNKGLAGVFTVFIAVAAAIIVLLGGAYVWRKYFSGSEPENKSVGQTQSLQVQMKEHEGQINILDEEFPQK